MPSAIHLTLMIGAVVPQPVLQSVVDALQEVQVTASSTERSGFQLRLAIGKRSPLLTELLPGGYFDAPRRVVIAVTMSGRTHVLIDGVIARQELTASSEAGQSTLTITGEDLTRMMDLVDLTGIIPYPAMPAEARILLALSKYAMYGIVPTVLPSVLISVPNPLENVPVHQGTDLAYITSLANQVGYVFHQIPGPAIGTSVAYWGPEIRTGPPQAALIVNSDAHSNLDTVTFGFDGFSKTLYVILIKPQELPIPLPIPIPDVNPLSPSLGSRQPFPLRIKPLTGLSRFTPVQAALIGLAKAAQAADVISGSGSVDVLRYGQPLRARQLVEVRGAGLPHDGLHFVKSVTHTLKPGSYTQSFSLTRNAMYPR